VCVRKNHNGRTSSNYSTLHVVGIIRLNTKLGAPSKIDSKIIALTMIVDPSLHLLNLHINNIIRDGMLILPIDECITELHQFLLVGG